MHSAQQKNKNAEQQKSEKLLETRKYLLKDFYLTRKVEINVESWSDEKRNWFHFSLVVLYAGDVAELIKVFKVFSSMLFPAFEKYFFFIAVKSVAGGKFFISRNVIASVCVQFSALFKLFLFFFPEFLHGTIKHIEMSHTLIQNVDDETFQGLRLESLKLVNNKLLEFSEKSFRWVWGNVIVSALRWITATLTTIKKFHGSFT